MGKPVRHIGEDARTGRLSYRRSFPNDLRPFLEKPRREFKVSLEVNGALTAPAMRLWEYANRKFEDELRFARAAREVDRKRIAGAFDQLTPKLIAHLVGEWKAEQLDLDTEVRWTARPREDKLRAQQKLAEIIQEDLDEALRLRALGDIEGISEAWGQVALDFAADSGVRLDQQSPQFPEYVRAFHDATIDAWQIMLRRNQGEDVPTPAVPPAPMRQPEVLKAARTDGSALSFHEIVERLIDRPSKPMSPTTEESVRTALRFFREANGTPSPSAITRAMVADWLDLLAQRPSKLPREHRAVPLPKLVDTYRDQPEVPRLSSKTLMQHLSALGARWTEAGKVGRIDRDAPNPFKDHDLDRTKRRKAAKGFSDEELKAILGLPVFSQGERPGGGKGDASYWLPLLLLFTGARPEEIAQLMVSDIALDAKSGRWVLTITDEGEHPYKGRRGLKTEDTPRTFLVPQQLIDWGLVRYVEALRTAGETALFPALRPTGKRGYLYTGFGKWWIEYLKDNEVRLEGAGRQPMRETRHTWSTAARASGISREAMAYIQGHRLADETAGEGYGSLNPLGLAIDRLRFEGLELSHVRPWTPERS